MYSQHYQGGHCLEILATNGKDPLRTFKVGKSGNLRKLYCKEVKGNVFCLGGASSKLVLPAGSGKLGIKMPVLGLQLKVPFGGDFSIQVDVTDSANARRKLLLSTRFRENASHSFHAQLPLGQANLQRDNWQVFCLDLEELVTILFKGGINKLHFQLCDRITISGSCKLRKVFMLSHVPNTMIEENVDVHLPSIQRDTKPLPISVSLPSSSVLPAIVVYNPQRIQSTPTGDNETKSLSKKFASRRNVAFGKTTNEADLPKTRSRPSKLGRSPHRVRKERIKSLEEQVLSPIGNVELSSGLRTPVKSRNQSREETVSDDKDDESIDEQQAHERLSSKPKDSNELITSEQQRLDRIRYLKEQILLRKKEQMMQNETNVEQKQVQMHSESKFAGPEILETTENRAKNKLSESLKMEDEIEIQRTDHKRLHSTGCPITHSNTISIDLNEQDKEYAVNVKSDTSLNTVNHEEDLDLKSVASLKTVNANLCEQDNDENAVNVKLDASLNTVNTNLSEQDNEYAANVASPNTPSTNLSEQDNENAVTVAAPNTSNTKVSEQDKENAVTVAAPNTSITKVSEQDNEKAVGTKPVIIPDTGNMNSNIGDKESEVNAHTIEDTNSLFSWPDPTLSTSEKAATQTVSKKIPKSPKLEFRAPKMHRPRNQRLDEPKQKSWNPSIGQGQIPTLSNEVSSTVSLENSGMSFNDLVHEPQQVLNADTISCEVGNDSERQGVTSVNRVILAEDNLDSQIDSSGIQNLQMKREDEDYLIISPLHSISPIEELVESSPGILTAKMQFEEKHIEEPPGMDDIKKTPRRQNSIDTLDKSNEPPKHHPENGGRLHLANGHDRDEVRHTSVAQQEEDVRSGVEEIQSRKVERQEAPNTHRSRIESPGEDLWTPRAGADKSFGETESPRQHNGFGNQQEEMQVGNSPKSKTGLLKKKNSGYYQQVDDLQSPLQQDNHSPRNGHEDPEESSSVIGNEMSVKSYPPEKSGEVESQLRADSKEGSNPAKKLFSGDNVVEDHLTGLTKVPSPSYETNQVGELDQLEWMRVAASLSQSSASSPSLLDSNPSSIASSHNLRFPVQDGSVVQQDEKLLCKVQGDEVQEKYEPESRTHEVPENNPQTAESATSGNSGPLVDETHRPRKETMEEKTTHQNTLIASNYGESPSDKLLQHSPGSVPLEKEHEDISRKLVKSSPTGTSTNSKHVSKESKGDSATNEEQKLETQSFRGNTPTAELKNFDHDSHAEKKQHDELLNEDQFILHQLPDEHKRTTHVKSEDQSVDQFCPNQNIGEVLDGTTSDSRSHANIGSRGSHLSSSSGIEPMFSEYAVAATPRVKVSRRAIAPSLYANSPNSPNSVESEAKVVAEALDVSIGGLDDGHLAQAQMFMEQIAYIKEKQKRLQELEESYERDFGNESSQGED